MPSLEYDTIIIGGGPAGLSAAKHLGYFKRRVLVIDRQTGPLVFCHHPIHNYLGVKRTISGQALLRQFQGEAKATGVEILSGSVVQVSGRYPQFQVVAEALKPNGIVQNFWAKTLLFSTGAAILHPKLNHQWQNWLPYASQPRVSYYCVDCEAPLLQDKSVLILSVGKVSQAIHNAQLLRRFTQKIEILALKDGHFPTTDQDLNQLGQSGFPFSAGTIQNVTIIAPGIKQMVLTHAGQKLVCNAFFISTLRISRSELAKSLGIMMNEHGAILTDEQGLTNVEGVWAAGDVRPIARQIAVAVGSGNYAALMINRKLAL